MRAHAFRKPIVAVALTLAAALAPTGRGPSPANAVPIPPPTEAHLAAALRKVDKTPCVCNDGGAYQGRAGLIYGEAMSSGATRYFTPFCSLFDFAQSGNLLTSGPSCFPFIPLAR